MTDAPAKTILTRIANVIVDTGAVEKTGKADQRIGGFAFHRIDEVVDHLRPVLIQHGVCYFSTITESVNEIQEIRGKPQFISTVKAKTTFAALENPDDCISVETEGIGIDSGDKGPGKAFSYALKTALLMMFDLRGQPDNEEHGHELPAVNPDQEELARRKAEPWNYPNVSALEENLAWETVACHASTKHPNVLLGELPDEDLKTACLRYFVPIGGDDRDARLRAALNLAMKEKGYGV